MSIPRGKYMGTRVGKDPDHKLKANQETDPENYYECDVCKQSVYMGDLGQVFYHETPEHEPMKFDS